MLWLLLCAYAIGFSANIGILKHGVVFYTGLRPGQYPIYGIGSCILTS